MYCGHYFMKKAAYCLNLYGCALLYKCNRDKEYCNLLRQRTVPKDIYKVGR